jgi:serpin B
VWTWPDYPLTEAFRTTITGRLGASLDGLDFADSAAVAAIDRWAADRTDGLVEEITDSLDGVPGEQAVMVLANATHFAGDWLQPFDPDETAPGPFTRDDGETVEAELMHQDAAEVAVVVDADRGLLLARLPYGAADGGEEVDPGEARFGLETWAAVGHEQPVISRSRIPSKQARSLPRRRWQPSGCDAAG